MPFGKRGHPNMIKQCSRVERPENDPEGIFVPCCFGCVALPYEEMVLDASVGDNCYDVLGKCFVQWETIMV